MSNLPLRLSLALILAFIVAALFVLAPAFDLLKPPTVEARSPAPAFLPSPPGPIFSDDFNDNSLDSSKWNPNELFSGTTDLTLPITETSQRLQIGPLFQNTSGSHYRGARSVNTFDFTGSLSRKRTTAPAVCCHVRIRQGRLPNTVTTRPAI